MTPKPALVCLGNLTIDDVVLPDGHERPGCTGGDALYAVLAARAWQPSAQMVAPVGNDVPAATLKAVARAGLSEAGLPRRDLPTLHNRVEYLAGGERRWTLHASEAAFDLLSPFPDDIPASYASAGAFLILAMTLSAQQRLAGALKDRSAAAVALDPQEDYIAGNEASLRALISSVDIFMPSAAEAARLLGSEDWSDAVRRFAAWGPGLVVLKLGAQGCLVYHRERNVELAVPAFPVAPVVDTTGAGDSFCGAFVAQYMRDPGDLRRAARAGAVAASFTVQGYGIDALLAADGAALRKRLSEWTD